MTKMSIADDATCFLHDEESGFEVLNILQTIISVYKLKINIDKMISENMNKIK